MGLDKRDDPSNGMAYIAYHNLLFCVWARITDKATELKVKYIRWYNMRKEN